MSEQLLYADIVVIICSTFIFITGVLGNAFIAAIILSRKKMRTVTNWFVLNLAICDLIIVLLVLPINQILPHMQWPFGSTACKYMAPIMEHFAGVCVLTHTCLSIARYIVIKNAMNGQLITLNHVRIAVVAVWVVPFLTMSATTLGIMGNAQVVRGNCSIRFYSTWYKIGYHTLVFSLTYVIPMTASGFSYFRITSMVNENMKHLNGHLSEELLNQRRDKSRRMNRVLISMYIAFGITTLPIQILLIVNSFDLLPKSYDSVVIFKICLSIFYGQVVTNPLVLFYMGEEYRIELYKMRFCFCAPKLQRKLSIYGTELSSIWSRRRSIASSNSRSFRSKNNQKPSTKLNENKPSLISPPQTNFNNAENTALQTVFQPDLASQENYYFVDANKVANPLSNNTNKNISADGSLLSIVFSGQGAIRLTESVEKGEKTIEESLNEETKKKQGSERESLLFQQTDTFMSPSTNNFITSTPKNGGLTSCIKPRRLEDIYRDVAKGQQTEENEFESINSKNNGQMKLSAYYDDGTLMYFYDSVIGRVSFSSDDGRETDL